MCTEINTDIRGFHSMCSFDYFLLLKNAEFSSGTKILLHIKETFLCRRTCLTERMLFFILLPISTHLF